MLLLALIETIKRTALKQPAIALSAGDSVPSEGVSSEAGDGVFAFAQRQHAGSVELDGVSFGFSLYYIEVYNQQNEMRWTTKRNVTK